MCVHIDQLVLSKQNKQIVHFHVFVVVVFDTNFLFVFFEKKKRGKSGTRADVNGARRPLFNNIRRTDCADKETAAEAGTFASSRTGLAC